MAMNVGDIYGLLGGVVCAYKPSGATFRYVATKLKANICRDLNNLENSLPVKSINVDPSNSETAINVTPSYADNVLCSGPKYQPNLIQAEAIAPLSKFSSGVLLMCINCKAQFPYLLKRLNYTKCYHLKGILGQLTDNYLTTGKVIAQAKYHKVCKSRFENLLASYQSNLHTRIFEEYGVPLNSQEAYNFAIRGLYRPVWKGPPITYSLKIAEFEPPNFTLEVQCVNENELYLKNLIYNLGVGLKCYATCAEIRCLRHGCFHIEHSLAKNQWNLDYIVDNIKLTWEILEKNYPNKLKFFTKVTTEKNLKVPKKDCL